METVIFSETSSVFWLGVVVGFFVHLFSSKLLGNSYKAKKAASIDNIKIPLGGNKMVLVVRNDLKMGKGKAAAQCAHGAVMAYEIASKKDSTALNEWLKKGQRKVVVKVESADELLQLARDADREHLIYALVKDAGLTQIPSGTCTVLAVGPAPEQLIDKVTGHLKLF